jgi:hypothetical protein
MHDRIGLAQRWGFWLWLVGTVACAGAVFGLLEGEYRDAGFHAIGAAFALSVVGNALLARRAGPGTAVLAVWSLGFGTWFPAWLGEISPLARHWLIQAGVTDPQLLTRLVLPLAILGAGVVTGALLYLMTRSGRVVVQTALISLVAAATPLLPVAEREVVLGGIVAWQAVVSGSLFRWMVDCARSGEGLACAACGFDLLGISSPVCPGCGKGLSRRQAVVPAGHLPALLERVRPAGRWY